MDAQQRTLIRYILIAIGAAIVPTSNQSTTPRLMATRTSTSSCRPDQNPRVTHPGG
jgi:hypothetical protein